MKSRTPSHIPAAEDKVSRPNPKSTQKARESVIFIAFKIFDVVLSVMFIFMTCLVLELDLESSTLKRIDKMIVKTTGRMAAS